MLGVVAAIALLGVKPAPAADGQVSTEPRLRSGYISNNDYPYIARRTGAEGVARVVLEIGTNGRVRSCTVEQSSGNAALDQVSCSIPQRRYRFAPATRNGVPVVGTYSLNMRWFLAPLPQDQRPAPRPPANPPR